MGEAMLIMAGLLGGERTDTALELQYAGTEKATGKVILLKRAAVLPTGGLPTLALKEAYFLKLLRSDYVRELLDIVQTPDYLYLVVQDCGPSLLTLLSTQSDQVTLSFRRKVTFNLLKCLEFLQGLEIMHLALSPRTILIGDLQRVRIEGFAAAQREGKWKARSNAQQFSVCMSPELIAGQAPTAAADMWSVAIVLLAMVTKERLDWVGSRAEVETLMEGYLKPEEAQSIRQKLRETAPQATPEELDLLQQLLSPNPACRPCARQALDHPYFSPEHCEATEE